MTDGNYKANNDLVWVINTALVPEGHDADMYTYEESFKGKHYKIPAARKKVVAMPRLTAARFLSSPGQGLAMPFPDGGILNPDTNEYHKERLGKPLKIVEMTAEEKANYGKPTESIEDDEPYVPAKSKANAVKVESLEDLEAIVEPKTSSRRKSVNDMAEELPKFG